MRAVLAVLVLLAGCDALWRIDAIPPPNSDAARGPDAPLLPDGRAHTGPFARFTMDGLDESLTSTVDSVGGFVATCQPDCPYAVTGHLAGALDFVGLDSGMQRLEIAAAAPFQIVDQFSITGWVRITSLATESCLWSKPYSSGAADTWQVCIGVEGAVSFYTYGPGGEKSIDTPGAWVALDNIFHHVAVVYDGANETLYWDGEVAAAGPAQPSLLVDNDPILIANDDNNGGFDSPFTGAVDDVQFFSYALDQTEIAVIAAQ
jgi:hypothetical protein